MTSQLVIGIHPDRTGHESYSEKWEEFLTERGIKVVHLNLYAQDALEQASGCGGVMWRWTHNPDHKQSAHRILYTIETVLDIPVFPDHCTACHYDEKVFQHYILRALGAPMPRAWVFWNEREALDWAYNADYPVVFKLSSGAGSSNVLKLNNAAEADLLIRQAFERGIFPYTMNEFARGSGLPKTKNQAKSLVKRLMKVWRHVWFGEFPALPKPYWMPEHRCVYFQEFLSRNDFDTRITVIGDRAFGFRRLNRPADFRASGSGKIDFDVKNLDPRTVEIAFSISAAAGFQCMAYDFLYKGDQPVVCEISYTFADWAVKACPGHWFRDLRWVPGHMWPEEAQVEDFLEKIRSR
jgi:glutathione synthase/RimK-type ligase-like ATP-grasp enzyme